MGDYSPKGNKLDHFTSFFKLEINFIFHYRIFDVSETLYYCDTS